MKVEIKTETGIREVEVRLERCALCGENVVYVEDGRCPLCAEWEASGLKSRTPCHERHITLERVDTGEFACELCDAMWLEEGKVGEAQEAEDYGETIAF
jgi:hypothetical protein